MDLFIMMIPAVHDYFKIENDFIKHDKEYRGVLACKPHANHYLL